MFPAKYNARFAGELLNKEQQGMKITGLDRARIELILSSDTSLISPELMAWLQSHRQ